MASLDEDARQPAVDADTLQQISAPTDQVTNFDS